MTGGLVEVELDDDDVLGAPRERRRRPRWPLRRWSWVAAVLSLVLVVATGVIGADAARRSGRGGVPGFASDLSVPRHEIWRQDGVLALATTPGLVLVRTPVGEGIRALRAEDGSTAWSVDRGGCSVVEIHGTLTWLAGLGPYRTSDPDDLRVLCTSYGTDTAGTALLDVSGSIVARLQGSDLMQVGQRLVGVQPDEGARTGATMRAWSLVDGSRLWERHFDGVDATSGYSIADPMITFPSMDGGTTIDVSTGEIDHAGDAVGQFAIDAEVGYGTLTSRVGPEGHAELSLVDPGGRTVWSRARVFYRPTTVTAPGADATVLASGEDNSLVALDGTTGEERWHTAADAASVLVHVPGIAVVGGATDAVLDDRTGDILWTAPTGEDLTAVSDREQVLLWARGTGEFVVRDLRDGHEVLRFPAPDLPYGDPGSGLRWGQLDGPVPTGGGILIVGSLGGVAALGP